MDANSFWSTFISVKSEINQVNKSKGEVVRKKKLVSGGFIIRATISVLLIVGYFYMNEINFIKNSFTITSSIDDIRHEPRKRILQIKTVARRNSKRNLLVTVPFWDTKRIGEQIVLRLGTKNLSQVKIDEFIYLHKGSVSILASFSILVGILLSILFFQRTSSYC